jgi:hypothetical protein
MSKPTLRSLAVALGAIDISDTTPQTTKKWHTLRFQYPDSNLLPEGMTPELQPPSLIEQMPYPEEDSEDVGIFDTSFFLRLPLQLPNPFDISLPNNPAAGLISEVDKACTCPGTSTLGMVSYVENGELKHHMFLRRKFPAQGVSFEFSEEELQKFLISPGTPYWVQMLSHLVNRASMKAYHHARANLLKYGGGKAVAIDEEAWYQLWDTKEFKPVKELLCARLFPDLPLYDMCEMLYGQDEIFVVELPCGHKAMIANAGLRIMGPEACTNYTCKSCGAPVLQEEDFNELCFRENRRKAKAYIRTNLEWMGLDAEVVEGEGYVDLYPATSLMCALSAALASLRPPMLISPPEMLFINFAETKAVFAELESVFSGDGYVEEAAPFRIFNGLMAYANAGFTKSELATDLVPPGWIEDVRRWFTRTTRLLCNRGCIYPGPNHWGVHMHREELFVGLLEPQDYEVHEDDGEERVHEVGAQVTSMSELTDLLHGSKIE